MRVIDYIPTGSENGISNLEFAILAGVDEREARRIVTRARIQHIPICSGPEGYFIPENLEELNQYIWTQNKRVKTGIRVLNGLVAARDEIIGQQSMYREIYTGGTYEGDYLSKRDCAAARRDQYREAQGCVCEIRRCTRPCAEGKRRKAE